MIKILGSLLLLLISLLEGGAIHATVDKKELLKGESVMLTITIVGEEYERMPDIPSIGGVPILKNSRTHSSNFIYKEGRSIMELTESLILEFKPKESMQIPPFQVEVDGKIVSTQPIDLKIVSTRSQKNSPFSVALEVKKKQVYLGEAFLAKISYKEQIGIDVIHLEYQEPSFLNLFSKRIGKERSYKKGGYNIHELTYLLVAQKTGELPLAPIEIKVAQRMKNEAFGGALSGVPKWHSIYSKQSTIKVNPLPQKCDMVGAYKLNLKIDRTKSTPNQAVNLTIELDGEGSLEDFEDIVFHIAGVSIYTDEANLTHRLKGGKIYSHYTKHYAFVSDHDFEIPAIDLLAFDYRTQKLSELKGGGYKIAIVNPSLLQTGMVDPKEHNISTLIASKKIPKSSSRSSLWTLLLASFLLGVLFTLFVRHAYPYLSPWLQRIKKHLKEQVSNDAFFEEALIRLYPHMGEHPSVEKMVRDLYAYRENDTIHIDKVLLKKMLLRFSIKTDTI
jgi:hypothetical protein